MKKASTEGYSVLATQAETLTAGQSPGLLVWPGGVC